LLFVGKSSTNAPRQEIPYIFFEEEQPMLISPAYAQAAGDTSSTLIQMAPLALIFVVFYFFLIRPQQTKAKQQRAMLEAIRRGDRVVTGGGIIGTVAKVVNNEELLVDIAENTRVRVLRSTVSSVLAKTEPVASKDKDTGKAKDEDRVEDGKEPETADAGGTGTPDKPKPGGWRRLLGG
jgi:preprotein translocase subunit YajC